MWKKLNTNRRWTFKLNMWLGIDFLFSLGGNIDAAFGLKCKSEFSRRVGDYREVLSVWACVLPTRVYTVRRGCTCWHHSTGLNLEIHECPLLSLDDVVRYWSEHQMEALVTLPSAFCPIHVRTWQFLLWCRVWCWSLNINKWKKKTIHVVIYHQVQTQN